MTEKVRANDYKGLDNRDLRLINIDPWEIPLPLKNQKVREIMAIIVKMEPGEVVKAYSGVREEARRLQSAVYRLVKRHEMGPISIVVRWNELYLKKAEEEGCG